MKILIIGNGAREHAIAWKIAKSPKVSQIYAAPGNGGMHKIAKCVDISVEDIDGLVNFAEKESIDLTIVGPEVPLVMGVTDKFNEKGLKIFGPNKKAAQLEGSKAYSKEFMQNHNIPTAKYQAFENAEKAIAALKDFSIPVVIKADGLAAGKGVLICDTIDDAEKGIKQIMQDKQFGEAGNKLVIEEYLTGIEASLLCFVSGDKIVPMESARDYKKALENDEGLNTGGMGSFSPNTIFNPDLEKQIKNEILDRFVTGCKNDNIDFKGILFIGLMIENNYTKVLEFNVRLGDPETEVVLPRLKSDLVDIFLKTVDGTISPDDFEWSDENCICAIVASGGYPEAYQKGKEISGLDELDSDIMVFHGGTKIVENKLLTNGGRVMAITALGKNLQEAQEKVYANIDKVKFEDMIYRKDIGSYNLKN